MTQIDSSTCKHKNQTLLFNFFLFDKRKVNTDSNTPDVSCKLGKQLHTYDSE